MKPGKKEHSIPSLYFLELNMYFYVRSALLKKKNFYDVLID